MSSNFHYDRFSEIAGNSILSLLESVEPKTINNELAIRRIWDNVRIAMLNEMSNGQLFESVVNNSNPPTTEMSEESVNSIFNVAGIKILSLEKIANEYRGFDKPTDQFWWWLVTTSFGKIVIGWRKNVIHIDWRDTKIPIIITDDDVTKSKYSVHAWSRLDASKYLLTLKSVVVDSIKADPITES